MLSLTQYENPHDEATRMLQKPKYFPSILQIYCVMANACNIRQRSSEHTEKHRKHGAFLVGNAE